MADEQSTWGILGGGVGATVVVALLGAWDKWWRRRDDHEEKEQKERDSVRASLDARQLAEMDRLERVVDRERARSLEVERQRDDAERGRDEALDTARAWKVRTHSMKHELDNARTAADGLAASRGLAVRPWFDETLPPLDGIVADNAARDRRYADWKGQRTPGPAIDPLPPT